MERTIFSLVPLSFALVLLVPTFAVAQGADGAYISHGNLDERVEALDALFQGWDRTDAPGCAVGVTRDGREVVYRAYGMADLEHSVPNTPSTIFEAGSVSKQFVAASIILLALEGVLSLDDDVREYVPELPDYGQTITIRHLLNHTSGLRDWGTVASISGWGRSSRTHDHDHVVEILSRQQALNYPPGERYSYTNSGYNLAAIIVDRVQDESFADFSAERIFRPLGMTSTQWRDDYRRVVPGRSSAYSGREGDDEYRINRPIEDVHGNGGLLTTVGDLLKWTHALATGYFGEEFTEEMHRQGVLNSGRTISYASGIRIGSSNGQPVVNHTGSTAGYRAYLGRYPVAQLGVAMLCNVTGVSTGGTGADIAEIFLNATANRGESSAGGALAGGIQLPAAQLEKKVGFYADERNHQPIELVYVDGELQTAGGTPLVPLTETEFRLGESGTHYRFEEADAGGRAGIRMLHEGYSEERLLPVSSAAELSESELQAYAGTYVSAEADTEIRIEVEDGSLTAYRDPTSAFTLVPVYEDAFEGFGLVRFHRDGSGRVVGFSYSSGRVFDMPFERR